MLNILPRDEKYFDQFNELSSADVNRAMAVSRTFRPTARCSARRCATRQTTECPQRPIQSAHRRRAADAAALGHPRHCAAQRPAHVHEGRLDPAALEEGVRTMTVLPMSRLSVSRTRVAVPRLDWVLLGSAAGYRGGAVDNVIMRLVDLMLVFPRFFLLLAVLALLRPSIWTIMSIIGLTGWMGVARLVRAEFLTLREREFVVWSESVGASAFRVVFRHILPNALAPVLVAMTLGIPAAILTESGLSFLGLGVQPPYATWGNILNDGKDVLEVAWWMTLYPGLAILITVLSYNLMGEGIRDALDPRLRQARVGRLVRLRR